MSWPLVNFIPITLRHFSIWRFLTGAYIFIFSLLEIPYVTGTFELSPLIYKLDYAKPPVVFDNTLSFFLFFRDIPHIHIIYLVKAIAGLFFCLGFYRRFSALVLCFIYSIINNSLPHMGYTPESQLLTWVLFVTLFISEIPWREQLLFKPLPMGCFRHDLFQLSIWIMVSCTYTYTCWTKITLSNPDESWRNGEALFKVLSGFAEVRSYIQEFSMELPKSILKILTYGVLLLEGIPLFLLPFSFLRKKWNEMAILLNLSILFTFELPQISLGMLLIHFLLIEDKNL